MVNFLPFSTLGHIETIFFTKKLKFSVTPFLLEFTKFSNERRVKKFRTSWEDRLSSIPPRCIIPGGIYPADFFPNCFEIPHFWLRLRRLSLN